VILCVVLAGFLGVMCGMVVMPVSDVGVMPCLLVISGFVLVGCGGVVLRRVFVMLRRLAVMVYCFFGHGISSLEIVAESILTAGCDGGITPG
jgi:hypothetical protein